MEAKASFTGPAMSFATAESRIAGVLRIAAKVASRLSSERKARIFSPGRFTTTSATIVSSEKTRSAMKFLTVSAVARMSPIGTCGPLGAAARAIWFRSPTICFWTTSVSIGLPSFPIRRGKNALGLAQPLAPRGGGLHEVADGLQQGFRLGDL